MFGKKLSGRWHLVRTRMQGKQPNWLLMKCATTRRARARMPTSSMPATPTSRKRMPNARHASRPRESRAGRRAQAAQRASRAARAAMRCPPAQAAARDARRQGAGRRRLGVRAQVRRRAAALPLSMATTCAASRAMASTGRTRSARSSRRSRNSNLDGAWVDGELIVTDPNGRSDFSLLQHTMEQGRLDELQFCIFDLLYLRGEDLRALPLSERKTRLDAASPGYRPRVRCDWPTRSTATARNCSRASATSTSKDWSPRKSTRPTPAIARRTGSR